jgi:hypothetical protein
MWLYPCNRCPHPPSLLTFESSSTQSHLQSGTTTFSSHHHERWRPQRHLNVDTRCSKHVHNLITTALKLPTFHIPLPDLPNRRSPLSTYGPRPVSSLSKFYQLNQSLSLKGPMTTTWFFNHSTIYSDLQLCLAIPNDLSLAIESSKDKSKGHLNVTKTSIQLL